MEYESEKVIFQSPRETIERLENIEEERRTLGEGDKVEEPTVDLTGLASAILKDYERNKDARVNSGIEDQITASLGAFNGEYSSSDLARISSDGQTPIFMELTATKSRAATSWIRDILLSPTVDPFSIESTKIPTLPKEIEALVTAHFNKELEEAERGEEVPNGTGQNSGEQQVPNSTPQSAPPLPQPAAPTASLSMKEANDKLLNHNRLSRDVKEALLEELQSIANFEVKQLERYVKDQLKEGGWQEALSDFIEDFCIFPTAFMKGPIIQRKKRVQWENGVPVPRTEYVFLNKRVSPLDIYPDPSSTTPQEGSFIEHVRFSEKEIRECKGLPGYKDEALEEVIEAGPSGIFSSYTSSGVEQERADLEKRGDTFSANENIYHGLHYWSSVDNKLLEEWGLSKDGDEFEEGGVTEVEAILVGHAVIKCIVNKDPLARRPYYKASYQNIPGAFWGRSLPSLMEASQRLCNACVRALAANMGYSSGPLLTVNIDRLADDTEMDEIVPLSVIQVTNDPSGNSGRPLEAFLVPSVANELLAVYDRFETKADDATGIPRYAYGTTGSNQGSISTASGMAMMLENATKSIKDAIRHISTGLIIPRVEYEFYWLLLHRKELRYTGDIRVSATGAEALTVKGAQEARQREFLQVTANQIDQEVMGVEGRAELLREMGKSLGLTSNIVPTKLELRKKEEEREQAMAARAKQEALEKEQEAQNSIQAVTIQSSAQERMSDKSQTIEAKKLEQKAKEHEDEVAIKLAEIKEKSEANKTKSLANSTKTVMEDERQRDIADQKAAIQLRTFGEKEQRIV